MKIEPPRELRPVERSVIETLLDIPFAGRDELRAQLPFVRIIDESFCCPSIKLAVDPERAAPAPISGKGPIVEAKCTDENGGFSEILLFVADGYLEDLETVHYVSDKLLRFPIIELVTLFQSPTPQSLT